MIDKLVGFGKNLAKRYVIHNVAATSAQIAYYWILAFFPFLIFVITLLSYTNIQTTTILNYLADVFPNSLMPFIESTIYQFIAYRSSTLLSIGVLITLWSGGTAVNALIKGIHLAYNSKYLKPFWMSKLMSIMYTFLLALLIMSSMIGLVFGNRLGEHLIQVLHLNKGIFMPVWNQVRLTLPLIALFVVLYIIYKYIPRKHLRCKNVWPGTFFAAFGWYAFSLIFSIYIDNYSKYNQMYGSIGSVFILLIWLYSSCMLLLLGAEINALYQDTTCNKIKRKFSNKDK